MNVVLEGAARRVHVRRVRPVPGELPGARHGQAPQPQAADLQNEEALLPGPLDRKLVDLYDANVLWQCTTCGACENQCPVGIEHLPLIIGSRRGLVSNGEAPGYLGNVYNHLERRGNIWGLTSDVRQKFVESAGLETFDATRHEYLMWLGCAGSYDAGVLWQCTTCGACERQCPVGIEHLPLVIGARRGLASNGEAPDALDKAGRLPAADDAGLAIRDKSNLVLGGLLFESSAFDRAKEVLDRIRLEGPFSNQALLRAGWAEATAEHFDRALVPWNILIGREPTDTAVQEAMLAAPPAYASLNLQGRAAILYEKALEIYSQQIERIDASIGSVTEVRFLEALVREEGRQDQGWVIRLRSLPDAPETYYLMELMASHEFQTALQNYLDLEDMHTRLNAWSTSLEAFEDVIRLRAQFYEPLLHEVDAQFRELDSRGTSARRRCEAWP